MKHFILMLKVFSRQKKQAFDKEHKHAKAQVPTNWIQNWILFPPDNKEGEKEGLHQRQASFSREAGEKERRQNKESSFFFFHKKKQNKQKNDLEKELTLLQ